MKFFFYRIVVLIAGLALLMDGLALADFLLQPLAGDFVFHWPIFRAFSILVLVPLTLLIGFLIIRRVPGNVVGPLAGRLFRRGPAPGRDLFVAGRELGERGKSRSISLVL